MLLLQVLLLKKILLRNSKKTNIPTDHCHNTTTNHPPYHLKVTSSPLSSSISFTQRGGILWLRWKNKKKNPSWCNWTAQTDLPSLITYTMLIALYIHKLTNSVFVSTLKNGKTSRVLFTHLLRVVVENFYFVHIHFIFYSNQAIYEYILNTYHLPVSPVFSKFSIHIRIVVVMDVPIPRVLISLLTLHISLGEKPRYLSYSSWVSSPWMHWNRNHLRLSSFI